MNIKLEKKKPTIYTSSDGKTSLYHGDSLNIMPQMPSGIIGGLVTDPPYSSGGLHSPIKNKPTTAKYQSYAHQGIYPEFEGDNRDQRSQLLWMHMWLSQGYRLVKDGGIIMCFTDWRQISLTCDALQLGGFIVRGIVPWDKTLSARPQRGRFRQQCEFVVWGSKGQLQTKNSPALPGLFTCSPQKGGKHHIAGKPVELMTDLIEIVPEGEPILDPFAGSGSTGVACNGRNPFVGIEMTKGNFDIAAERLGLFECENAA